MRFWDSSAVAPLVAVDRHLAGADRLLAADPAMAVWCMTPVEVWSSIARRRREGALRSPDVRRARAALDSLARSWTEVGAVEPVRTIARRVLDTHPLRAADALQLAAALFLVEERADGLGFVTFDARLAAAAEREGFLAFGAEAAE